MRLDQDWADRCRELGWEEEADDIERTLRLRDIRRGAWPIWDPADSWLGEIVEEFDK